MVNYSFLKDYVLPSEKEGVNPVYADYKHHFFPIAAEAIEEVDCLLKVPVELREFYSRIGYGFFYQTDKSSFNRLLDVYSFRSINLKEDYYQSDPVLEVYEKLYKGEKLLFFEIIEGQYLAINKEALNGKNAIYYFQSRIADSLEEFVKKLDADPEFISEME